jgi:hypothetical protein
MKLQSAIEFLVTYGWALLIIAIMLFALFTSGILNSNAYASQKCVLTSGFSCLSFFISGNGLLTINLLQSLGESINVTALGCNQNGTLTHMQQPYNPPTGQIFMPIGSNYTFNVQCYTNTGPFSSNTLNSFSGVIIVNYTNDLTGIPQTAFGKVNIRVS